MTAVRQHFTIDRSMEYFTAPELIKQIGTTMDKWVVTLAKELIDNAADAAESAGVIPDIVVTVDENSISIRDNGPGIPEQVIMDSMNYAVRVSDKQGYVSPSRGQQGNAMMCVYACPFVLDGDHAHVEIHSNGTRHDIHVSLDRIAQTPKISTTVSKSEFIETGTFIKINDLKYACVNGLPKSRISIKAEFLELISLFSCCNPHANFTLNFDGESHPYLRSGNQTKWTTNMPLVCHWYYPDQFINLVASLIHKNPDMKVNNFLKMFDGLKASPKQKQVCDDTGISSREGIQQFVANNDIDRGLVVRLLESMTKAAREIKPSKLGSLNVDHVKAIWADPDHRLFEYRSSKGMTGYGLPYTLDVFFQMAEGLSYRAPEICLNNSVLIDGDIHYMSSLLAGTFLEIEDQARLLIHITCPSFDFAGKGKNKISLPTKIFVDLKKRIAKITGQLTRTKKH